MNNQKDTTCSNTSGKLLSMITAHIEELAQATDTARMSEEMVRYLDACSRFHKYSPCNVWLILMQRPQASMVAGYRKWQSMNRNVRTGERGIPILAPIMVKEKVGEEEKWCLRSFKVVHVFDISQTVGEPLPELPEWKSPEKNLMLAQRLLAFAKSKGITIMEKELAGDVQGVSKGGSIVISPIAGTATLIHEIAHELLHRGVDRPLDPGIREMEAEAIAFVVGKQFGLDSLTSPNYVALHGADSTMILEHMERICRISTEIFERIS